ncbi:MAG TPA: hypothetical protein VK694_05835 [Verrucomicrobiae bacterium]|nr:hypothetical protein [Verrucomicrobiae bacterium]
MPIIGYHLDGSQLAIHIFGIVVAVALGIAALVSYQLCMRDARRNPEKVLDPSYKNELSRSTRRIADLGISAVFFLLLFGLCLPLSGQSSRNRNSHERATVVQHAEFYDYTAVDIHPNSDEFTAVIDGCELPAKYWRDGDQVIGTELTLADMQVYSVDTPDRMIFVRPDDEVILHYPEVIYFCQLQDVVLRVPPD